MIEEHSFASFHNGVDSLISSECNAVTCNRCNFEKYDPYVEKIRALFVPSLERRIHSCLETLVYRREQSTDLRYPKRYLDVAATWGEPIDAFCTKWDDGGFLENMLSHAVKYFIKDGLVDCFLNSIILSNRLNKICRHLDGLEIERDFLRHLNVWNYINERDYWIENNERCSISMPQRNCDPSDHHSDLDVEVGSELCNYRNDQSPKKCLKRRATHDFRLEVNDNEDSMEHLDDPECPGLRNWLSIESIEKKGSGSNDSRKNKSRSICHSFSCRTSTCSIYRIQSSERLDWDGKTLKLRLSKEFPRCKASESSKTSKLPLPCKFDDLMSKIVEKSMKFGSIGNRKKFKAGVTNMCRLVNHILGKMSKNEVRRCILHCHVFSGHINFGLTKRESNGCKVCLLSDRVLIGKMRSKSQSVSQKSSLSHFSQTSAKKNSSESGLTIWESAQCDVNVENPLPNTGAKINVKEDSEEPKQFEEPSELTRSKDWSKRTQGDESLNKSTGNRVQECLCDESFDNGIDNFDGKLNKGTDRLKDARNEAQDALKDLVDHETLILSHGNALKNQTCPCTILDHYLENEPENNQEIEHVPENQTKKDNLKESVCKDSSVLSISKTFDDQICLCNESLEATRDSEAKNISKELPSQESVINSIDGVLDQSCPCNTFHEDSPNINDDKAKKNEDSCSGCLEMCGENVVELNSRKTNNVVFPKTSPKIDVGTCCSPIEKISSNHRDLSKSELTRSESILNATHKLQNLENQRVCECPLDCNCSNKCLDEHVDCDSECSCDSCHDPDDLLNPNDSIVLDVQNQTSWIETQPKTRSSLNKSEASLKSNATVILSRQSKQLDTKASKSVQSDQRCLRTSSAQCKIPEIDRIKDRSNLEVNPVISARLPKSKTQRINISIELCPESGSSLEKMVKNRTQNIKGFNNLAKQSMNFEGIDTKTLPISRQVGCQSCDLENIDKRALCEKSKRNECSRNSRLHSPARPLESREYVPSLKRESIVRNQNVCGMPIRSNTSSNDKFASRPMSQDRGSLKLNSIKKYRDPNDTFQGHPLKNEASVRSPQKSEIQSFPNERREFSSSSVDRMRHLIKTKLRRILLERDKSTNTPKTAYNKYGIKVPFEKCERPRFSSKRCCTIWESHSVSNSSCTSRSIATKDRKEIANLLYSSRTNIAPLNWNRRKNDARKKGIEVHEMNKISRLAGGCDMIPVVKSIEDTQSQYSKNRRQESLNLEGKNCRPTNRQSDELTGQSLNCHFHDILENYAPPSNTDEEISRKNRDDKLIACSRKLDSSMNSTSRHIYLYEFAQSETSNDESSKRHRPNSKYRPKNVRSSEIQKNSRIYERIPRDSESRKSRHEKRNRISRSTNELKKSFSNEITDNYQDKSFCYLDQDLRSKLAQYVNLCKNVKYSLLRRLRPEQVYQVSGTSIFCTDR